MVEVLPPTRAPSLQPPARARLVAALLFIVLIPLASPGAVAQTAQLGGRLTDSTSAVLPGAAISVGNVETGMTREAASNEEGYYTGTLPSSGQLHDHGSTGRVQTSDA